MIAITGRHVARRAYPSARRVMRATGLALLGIASLAGYVLAVTSHAPVLP